MSHVKVRIHSVGLMSWIRDKRFYSTFMKTGIIYTPVHFIICYPNHESIALSEHSKCISPSLSQPSSFTSQWPVCHIPPCTNPQYWPYRRPMRHGRCLRPNWNLLNLYPHHTYYNHICHLRAHPDMPESLPYVPFPTISYSQIQILIQTEDCQSGGSGDICCSTYCAATKCRPTDPKWPNCREDLELCEADEQCCYNNKCVEGLCRKA